jgi:DNA-directed RNA polymerase specialized sigma24 family protein
VVDLQITTRHTALDLQEDVGSSLPGGAMGFREDLAKLTRDPAIRRLAASRTGSRELAEDALQETYCAVLRVKIPQAIQDLRAYYCRSLIREITYQRSRSTFVPVEDIATTTEQVGTGSSLYDPPASVENEASIRHLAETVLSLLEQDRDQLMSSVPARSADHRRYRATIAATARAILLLLLQGDVASADWNAILKSGYPQWYDEPGLARDALDQRLSRARRDVRLLIQKILPRYELRY